MKCKTHFLLTHFGGYPYLFLYCQFVVCTTPMKELLPLDKAQIGQVDRKARCATTAWEPYKLGRARPSSRLIDLRSTFEIHEIFLERQTSSQEIESAHSMLDVRRSMLIERVANSCCKQEDSLIKNGGDENNVASTRTTSGSRTLTRISMDMTMLEPCEHVLQSTLAKLCLDWIY